MYFHLFLLQYYEYLPILLQKKKNVVIYVEYLRAFTAMAYAEGQKLATLFNR